MSKHLYLAALASLLLAIAPSFAQAPAPSASPAPAASPAPTGDEAKAGEGEQTIDEILAGEEEVMSGEGYSYDPAGRRDPFVSLLQRNVAKELQQPRPEGIPGLLIDEVEVKGIYTVSGRTFAQVQTSNKGKNYTIQEGDQLYDGEVVSITADTVTFKQVVNDPSVIKPFREVVKKLNPEP